MIQKKKFSDAIAANISVVGGLLGINNTFLKDRGVVTDNFNKIGQVGVRQIFLFYYNLCESRHVCINKHWPEEG